MYKRVILLFASFIAFSSLGADVSIKENPPAKTEEEMIELENTTLHHLDTNFLEKLIRMFKLDVFVETSTYLGETSIECAKLFKEVYTVEENHKLFLKAKKKFKNVPNVYCFEGTADTVLKKHLPKIQGRILFWLDSHHKYALDKNQAISALNKELDAIKASEVKDAVVLINQIQIFQKTEEDGYSLDQLKESVLEINPDYQFWILGNIAIAFPKQDNVPVSPLVKACTTSRLFNDENFYQQVLQAEKVIMESFAQKEHLILDGLHEAFTVQKQAKIAKVSEDPAIHYILWKGLSLLGQKQYFEASRCFHSAVAKGCHHWRVYWYIAQAEYERRNLLEAERALQRVLKAVPDFSEAKELAEKIKVKN